MTKYCTNTTKCRREVLFEDFDGIEGSGRLINSPSMDVVIYVNCNVLVVEIVMYIKLCFV